MSVSSLGITLKRGDSIECHVSRSEETAWMAIKVDGARCEIRMERVHVEALRDQLPGVLEGLERFAAEDAAWERAGAAAARATDAAATALDKARSAEESGAHEVAASLRAAAAEATETANAVDQAVGAFVEATLEADRAADRLVYASWQADSEAHQHTTADQSAECSA